MFVVLAWCKSRTKNPGPGTSVPWDRGTWHLGPPSKFKSRILDPFQNLKLEHQDLLQSLKVGPS